MQGVGKDNGWEAKGEPGADVGGIGVVGKGWQAQTEPSELWVDIHEGAEAWMGVAVVSDTGSDGEDAVVDWFKGLVNEPGWCEPGIVVEGVG